MLSTVPARELSWHAVEWQLRARCKTKPVEWFFPHQGDVGGAAKLECAKCPVRGQCLAWSIVENEKLGIWGGLAVSQRRPLRKRWREGESIEDIVIDVVGRAMFSSSFQ